MRVRSIATLAILGTGTWAQTTFEPPEFNITEALLKEGVNVSAIPQLKPLVERSSFSGCSIACSSLQLLFGNNKLLAQQSSGYESFTNSYWSVQQASVDPRCIFKPSSQKEVSVVVLLSRLTQCPFAVKSGGHAAFGGASSMPGGITVALENMKSITLSSDKKVASIEPGNTWYDVYTQLQGQNLAVIGGRVAPIGVGGLTLGGGISFFANRYGWACDNVVSFEVVTASGIEVTASPTSFPDLYWALRGGGNNFGIVTKFNLETIPLGGMWGGDRLHVEPQFPAVIQAFYNLGKNSAQDVDAAQILSFAFAQGMKFASAALQYAKPVVNPPIFKEYLSINPPVLDNTRLTTLPELTQQFNASNPKGLHETYWAVTFKLDKAFISYVKDVFFQEVATIADAPALVPACTLQVITVPQLQKMSKNGGNALGLSASDGPLLLVNLNMMWLNAADEPRILKANSNIVKKIVDEGKKRGLYDEYIYMNYASQFQDVIASYGAANKQKLKAVAHKYDPQQVFQELQPGYFKLDGPPNPNMP